jgi:hypothetical protein
MRLRQNAPARSTLVLAVLLMAALVLAVKVAIGGERSSGVASYRYAGVIQNGRGAPAHYLAIGDGFRLLFFDALSQGRRSQRYRVCLGPPGKPAVRCWRRTARYGLSRVILGDRLPPEVSYGAVTARWWIGDRIVTTWPFLYVRGGL